MVLLAARFTRIKRIRFILLYFNTAMRKVKRLIRQTDHQHRQTENHPERAYSR